jgi:hypothetical protein
MTYIAHDADEIDSLHGDGPKEGPPELEQAADPKNVTRSGTTFPGQLRTCPAWYEQCLAPPERESGFSSRADRPKRSIHDSVIPSQRASFVDVDFRMPPCHDIGNDGALANFLQSLVPPMPSLAPAFSACGVANSDDLIGLAFREPENRDAWLLRMRTVAELDGAIAATGQVALAIKRGLQEIKERAKSQLFSPMKDALRVTECC